MTRWLRAAKHISPLPTEPTQPTKPNQKAKYQTFSTPLGDKSVKSERGNPVLCVTSAALEMAVDQVQERAAIMEFDGGLNRPEAEHAAAEAAAKAWDVSVVVILAGLLDHE